MTNEELIELAKSSYREGFMAAIEALQACVKTLPGSPIKDLPSSKSDAT